MFKKILALIICVLVLSLILVGCNKADRENISEPDSLATESEQEATVNDGKLRIFSNGEYNCRIIRPENSTPREREFYIALRSMLKQVTGVNPPISTDFKNHDEQYDENEFAILVGHTKYEESSELYSKLTYSDFRAELIDKKYAIAFHDFDTATSALESLKKLFTKNYKNGEIILDESWSFSYSEDELLKSIPIYDGGVFSDVHEGAYEMQTVVIQNTDKNEYNAYLTSLSAHGFSPYTDNSIGKNLFATYTSDKYILNAMFFDAKSEVRITMEYTGNYSLPALEDENIYTPTDVECSVTQIGLEESTGKQNGMSYVFKLADGSFFIIDGGMANAKDQFMEVITSLADDPENITVASWLITHAHGDHFGLLYSVLYDKECLDVLNIEQIIWSKVSEKQLSNIDGGNMDYIDKMFNALEDTKIVIAHPGQVFYIRNATYTVYATIELVEPFALTNLNDSSIVGRLVIDGKSLFFPGDSHPTETDVLTSLYFNDMKSDVVQVIHHGYQGGNASFYSSVDPLTVFWPLGMKNYEIGGTDSTPMKTWSYSAWLFSEESKVQKIYVAGSDVTTLLISELPSHANS